MNYELSNRCRSLLEKQDISFKKAKLDELDKILVIYSERTKWFKDKKINQWSKYLEHHPRKEFQKAIKEGYFFLLKKNKKIIACFELSYDSKYWKDSNSQVIYIYKIVTKIESKKLGSIIFEICKDIAKTNNKKRLRLDCLSTNKKLNAIYENYGFKLIRTGCEDYYHYSLREYIIDDEVNN